jgi:TolB-like protein
MSSIINGYNYDIFISYRQKDNKGDRWVSEFVEALKTELESTFKEEISVYFDINPHDGLLETHEVDESLKDKLKCLVFIPIISRTFCDSRSFAWEYEFKAFVRLASQDRYGLKVRLPGGNVASRVLPVRIHDLEEADIKEFESVLGGVLRGVEFIYKSPGVNRPLRSREDNPHDNLNHTTYRDQINKVALAIKEIMNGITESERQSRETVYVQPEIKPEKKRSQKTKLVVGVIIMLALLVAGYIFIPKMLKSSPPSDKSIAVLPFTNLSNDPEQEYFSEGVVETILTHLVKVGDLKVISSTSTKRFKNSELSIKEIARDLGVSAILEGSIQKIENNVRITVQLIDAGTDVHLWSEIYDRDISDLLRIESEVAQNVARELKAKLTAREKVQIEKKQTNNPVAYNFYLQGRFFWNKRTEEGLNKSVEYFEKAIAADPDYALAYAGLADAYFIQAYWGWIPKSEGFEKSKATVLRALDLDEDLSEAHTVLGTLYTYKEWNWEEARKELKLSVELNPNFVTAHHYYSELLDILGENREARIQINRALELDPYLPVLHMLSGPFYYYNEGKLKETLDEIKILDELDPDYSEGGYHSREFYIYSKQNDGPRSAEALQKLFKNDSILRDRIIDVYAKSGIDGLWNLVIQNELKKREPDNLALARWYSILNRKNEALDWLEKAFDDPPPSMPRINCIPDFDNIRSEPRFQAIIKKMGLSEYQKRL